MADARDCSAPLVIVVGQQERGGLKTCPRWVESSECSGPNALVFSIHVADVTAVMVDRFLDGGFDEQEVHTMAVLKTRRVAGADQL
jgi:hypothetical protein